MMKTSSQPQYWPYGKITTTTIPIIILLFGLVADITLAAPHYRRFHLETKDSRHVLSQENVNGGQPSPALLTGPRTTIAITVGGANPTKGVPSPVRSGSGDHGGMEIAEAQDGMLLTSPLGSGEEGDVLSFANPASISPITNPVALVPSGFQQVNNNDVPPQRVPSPVVLIVDDDHGGSQQGTTLAATPQDVVTPLISAQSDINNTPAASPVLNNIQKGGQQVDQQDQSAAPSPNAPSSLFPLRLSVPTVVIDEFLAEPPASPPPSKQPSPSSIIPSPQPEKQAESLTAELLTSPSAPATLLSEVAPVTPPPSTPALPTTPTSPTPTPTPTPPEAVKQAQVSQSPPSGMITKTLSIRLTTIASTVTHLVTVTETLTPSTSSSIPPSTATANTSADEPVLNNGTSSNSTMSSSSGSVSIEALLASSMSSSTFLTMTRGNGTTTMTATGAGSGYRESYLYRQQYRPLTAA